MKLMIIRHGETQWNKLKKMQGQVDIELNEYGRELAQITSNALKDEKIDIIYSSPLVRAYETAQIIKGDRQLEIIKDDLLKEICFGEDEGVESDKLRKDFSNFFFAPHLFVPSKGGETYEELITRAKIFLEKEIFPYKESNKTILIVAHGAMNKALMFNLTNKELKDFWSGSFQKNCCLNEYIFENDEIKLITEAKIFYEGETTDYLKK